MSTALTVLDRGSYLALNHSVEEVAEFIEENLSGEDISEFDLRRITVPSGKQSTYRFEVPTLEGSDVVEEISGVIVHHKNTRSYWPTSIDDGGGNIPPSCSSPDAKVGFGKPWATRDNPNPDGEPEQRACASCPNAQFGSAGRGQACSQKKQLFMLTETGFLPVVVNVPAMSLQPVKKYLLALADQNIRYDQVVTTLALEKAQNQGGVAYARIVPRLGGKLDEEEASRARAYGDMLRPQFDRVAGQMSGQPAAGQDGPSFDAETGEVIA